MKSTTVTAALIIIGNEILSGRTRDSNLQSLAAFLGSIGIRLVEARVIPDIEDRIISTVNELRQSVDYLFTTGGIGPTHDDITSEAVAKAFGCSLFLHPQAEALLKAYYPAGKINPARMKMAMIPAGAELIHNPVSAAPGFRIGNVHVLAGVPAIMEKMLLGLRPTLQGGRLMNNKTLTVLTGEGDIAAEMSRLQLLYPEVDIGSYPFLRVLDPLPASPANIQKPATHVVFRSEDPIRLADAFNALQHYCSSNGIDVE